MNGVSSATRSQHSGRGVEVGSRPEFAGSSRRRATAASSSRANERRVDPRAPVGESVAPRSHCQTC